MTNQTQGHTAIRFNWDLITRLSDEQLGAFIRWCKENNKDADGLELNEWNARIYNKLYQTID